MEARGWTFRRAVFVEGVVGAGPAGALRGAGRRRGQKWLGRHAQRGENLAAVGYARWTVQRGAGLGGLIGRRPRVVRRLDDVPVAGRVLVYRKELGPSREGNSQPDQAQRYLSPPPRHAPPLSLARLRQRRGPVLCPRCHDPRGQSLWKLLSTAQPAFLNRSAQPAKFTRPRQAPMSPGKSSVAFTASGGCVSWRKCSRAVF